MMEVHLMEASLVEEAAKLLPRPPDAKHPTFIVLACFFFDTRFLDYHDSVGE